MDTTVRDLKEVPTEHMSYQEILMHCWCLAYNRTDFKWMRTILQEPFTEPGRIIDLRFSDGDTALHRAIRSGHRPLIVFLWKHKANYRIPGFDQKTAFHIAVEKRHHAMVQHMLAADPDPFGLCNMRDRDGYTPYLHALYAKNLCELFQNPEHVPILWAYCGIPQSETELPPDPRSTALDDLIAQFANNWRKPIGWPAVACGKWMLCWLSEVWTPPVFTDFWAQVQRQEPVTEHWLNRCIQAMETLRTAYGALFLEMDNSFYRDLRLERYQGLYEPDPLPETADLSPILLDLDATWNQNTKRRKMR